MSKQLCLQWDGRFFTTIKLLKKISGASWNRQKRYILSGSCVLRETTSATHTMFLFAIYFLPVQTSTSGYMFARCTNERFGQSWFAHKTCWCSGALGPRKLNTEERRTLYWCFFRIGLLFRSRLNPRASWSPAFRWPGVGHVLSNQIQYCCHLNRDTSPTCC